MSHLYYSNASGATTAGSSGIAYEQQSDEQGQPVTIDLTQDDSPPSSPTTLYGSQRAPGFTASAVSAAPSSPYTQPSSYSQPAEWMHSSPRDAFERSSGKKRKRQTVHRASSPETINLLSPQREMSHEGFPTALSPIPNHDWGKRPRQVASPALGRGSQINPLSIPKAAIPPMPQFPSAANMALEHQTSQPPTSYGGGLLQYLMPSHPSQGAQPANTAPPMPDEPLLCPEQAALVDLICSGRNVFYTGSAGCGKSTVLRAFTRRLQAEGKKVRILAPTGRAALQVNGSTTWTYAGWTPDHHKKPLIELKAAAHGKFVWERLKLETDVIVIDEISMVENLHLERLNELMKEARQDPMLEVQPAFGGAQVIVTGDFCQLPPVKPFQHCIECGRELTEAFRHGRKTYTCPQHGVWRDEDKWAFRSKAWQECKFEHVHLKQIHRQSDEEFIRMLQKTRIGEALTPPEIKRLLDHPCRVANATRLFATRDQVREVNQKQFKRLTGVNHSYWCRDVFKWQQDRHPHLQWKGVRRAEGPAGGEELRPLRALDDHRFDELVQLKQGMLVVLLVNLDLAAGLCNGSQGLICGFETYDPKKMPKALPQFNGKRRKDEELVFDKNRIYGDHALMKEHEIKAFIESKRAQWKRPPVWPVVRFHNGAVRVIYADCSISNLGDKAPYSLLARTQIPLAPAWAMTIHKSQSLTMDRVIVNLSRAFEEGQVYVALSRATGLEGLKIEGDADALSKGLGGNKEVQQFLRDKFGALSTLYSSSGSDQA